MKNSFAIAAALAGGVCAAAAAGWAVLAHAADVGTVNTTVGEQVGIEKMAQASQTKINQLDDETQRMLDDYRATSREAESLRRYNEQLALQIKSQEDEMVSIQKQIEQIDRTNREIYPLMTKMVDTLSDFVVLDLPFLSDERAKRIAAMKEMMPRADVSTAEKYRRILEAYQVEMEYGRTIEAYEDKLGAGDDARTVNFLRVGRVALLYQTLDGSETGYWDAENKKWEKDNGYADAATRGLKIARKQTAPDLLVVPVLAAKKEAK